MVRSVARVLAAVVCVGTVAFVFHGVPALARRSSPQFAKVASASRTISASLQKLEAQHLREEIAALRQAIGEPWWQRQGNLGLIGASVAVLGLLWTVVQQRREFSRQREADRAGAAREQQARLDGLFAGLAGNLASDQAAVRLAAVAGIESFTVDDRVAYHEQLLAVLLGILKVPRGDISDRVLARAFVAFLRRQQARGAVGGSVDLERACLAHCHLEDLDLRGADLRSADLGDSAIGRSVAMEHIDGRELHAPRLRAPGAQMTGARLDGATLQEARLRGAELNAATFRRAMLVSADLRDADLRDARFNGAQLQGAHLDGADLRGARFDGADLRDAYFRGALLDDGARQSIKRTPFWGQAHLENGALDSTGE